MVVKNRFLPFREARRLRVFENRICRDENRERRRFHNEERHGLYSLPNIVRLMPAPGFSSTLP